jgi:hypothetical protein
MGTLSSTLWTQWRRTLLLPFLTMTLKMLLLLKLLLLLLLLLLHYWTCVWLPTAVLLTLCN